jgi:hypothetical protein
MSCLCHPPLSAYSQHGIGHAITAVILGAFQLLPLVLCLPEVLENSHSNFLRYFGLIINAITAPMENFSTPFTQAPIPGPMGQYVPPHGTSANVPSQVAQTFSQNMASISANNLLGTQPRPSSQMNSPQSGASPAAPAQSQAQAQAQAQFAAREKARVTALLDINSALLQEVVNLQAAGKAGPASNPDTNSPTSEQVDASKANQKPSPEYIECMRRLQANLAYLATIADRAKKAGGVVPQTPAIMTPPPNLPALNDLYAKLNELFPRSGKTSTPQRLSPNGGPSPSAMNESIV